MIFFIAVVGILVWKIHRRNAISKRTYARERSLTEVFGRAEDVEMQKVRVSWKTAQFDGSCV